jgi:hypothetical protein
VVIVVYRINGRKVAPRQAGSPLRSALLDDTTKQVQQQLGSLVCPIHHRAPVVLASGASLYGLEFTAAGCCQVLIELATPALNVLNERRGSRPEDVA